MICIVDIDINSIGVFTGNLGGLFIIIGAWLFK